MERLCIGYLRFFGLFHLLCSSYKKLLVFFSVQNASFDVFSKDHSVAVVDRKSLTFPIECL